MLARKVVEGHLLPHQELRCYSDELKRCRCLLLIIMILSTLRWGGFASNIRFRDGGLVKIGAYASLWQVYLVVDKGNAQTSFTAVILDGGSLMVSILISQQLFVVLKVAVSFGISVYLWQVALSAFFTFPCRSSPPLFRFPKLKQLIGGMGVPRRCAMVGVVY